VLGNLAHSFEHRTIRSQSMTALTKIIRSNSAALTLLALLISGCGHAPMAYQLRREGLDPVLFPPTQLKEKTTAAEIRVSLKNARAQSESIAVCDIDGDVVSLHWQGTTAVVALHTQSFYAPAADQSPNQSGRGLYVDPLVAMEKFHADLLERQTKGCIRADENTRLRRAIVENLPLPPTIAYFFELGSYDVTGYFDLTSDFRLITTSPLYRPDSDQTPDNLIGYETAHYVFLPDPTPSSKSRISAASPKTTGDFVPAGSNTDRIRLYLSRATEVLNGDPAIEKRTLRNDLHFPQSSAYFRLLFMADDNAAAVRVTRAVLLSAPNQSLLAEAIAWRQVKAENFCATLAVPDVTCTVFPKNFGVSPELRIRANGQPYYVGVGGFLLGALDWHPGDHAPKTLKVRRLFRGRLIPVKFDPNSDDILRLVLLPGDEITW
jgi:hypothetical protein